MLDRTQRLRRGAATAVGMATAVVVLASCGDAPGPTTSRTRCTPPVRPRTRSCNLIDAVLLDRGRRSASASSAATIFVALRFREQPGDERSPVQIHGNTVLEISWTIIPFLILAVMAVPTVATIFNLAKMPTGPNVVHVTVDGPAVVLAVPRTPTRARSFYTANEMHIPIGRPVVLTLTSNNVIHSFWVPELAGKKDVVPGHPNTLDDRGRARPARSSGSARSTAASRTPNMRLRVIAQTEADYDAWVAPAADAARRRPSVSRVRHARARRGAARRATRSRTSPRTSARRSGRTSRTSATARRSPATSTR